MKFGKQIKRLADPADLNHYLAYDVLKKAKEKGSKGRRGGEVDHFKMVGVCFFQYLYPS